jgi:hypothetical protein
MAAQSASSTFLCSTICYTRSSSGDREVSSGSLAGPSLAGPSLAGPSLTDPALAYTIRRLNFGRRDAMSVL